MTAIEFAKGMAFLGACLDRSIPKETVQAWFMVLGDMQARDFERAVIEVVRNHKFSGLPPIGLIRQAAGLSGGVSDADQSAVLAWDKVLKAMREHGAYHSIAWDDPAIKPAIETVAGTWTALCDEPSDKLLTWKRKEFLEAYKAHRTARTVSDGISIGLIAADAGRLGYEAPEASRIGAEPKRLIGFGIEDHDAKRLEGPQRVAQPMAMTFAESFGRMPSESEPDEPEEPPVIDEEKRRRMMAQLKRMADSKQIEINSEEAAVLPS